MPTRWNGFCAVLHHKKTGSGIGLSLSRQIMRQHGGQITVKSKLGEGTEFLLRFYNCWQEIGKGLALKNSNMQDVQHKINAILIEKLGIPESQITSDASFVKDLGIDSLDYAELVMEFEQPLT